MPRSSFQRSTRARVTGPKLLIACEGDGEKAYLEGLRQELRLSDRQIVVLNEKGTDPQYQKPLPLSLMAPEASRAAIQRADRLAEHNREAEQPFYNNPSSGMGRLIELLLELDKSL